MSISFFLFLFKFHPLPFDRSIYNAQNGMIITSIFKSFIRSPKAEEEEEEEKKKIE